MSIFNAKVVLIIGSACLVTACGGAVDQVGDLKDKASQVQDLADKAGNAKDLLANAGPLKDKVFGMKDSVSQTLASVKSGDFAAAQESFGTVKQSWGEIEGEVKILSADGHSKIQTGIDTVEADLNSASPDADKIAGNLKGLTGSISELTGGGSIDTADSTDGATTIDSAAAPEDGSAGGIGGGELASDNSVASNLSAMKRSLADTTTAVESADFGTAKTAFADARQSWFKFGGSIKQSSSETYQSIDDGVKTVNSAINGADPSAEVLLGDLSSLSDSLNEVTPE